MFPLELIESLFRWKLSDLWCEKGVSSGNVSLKMVENWVFKRCYVGSFENCVILVILQWKQWKGILEREVVFHWNS